MTSKSPLRRSTRVSHIKVNDECTAERHNTVAAAQDRDRPCICPDALAKHENHKATRRVTESSKRLSRAGDRARARDALHDVLEPVGEAANVVLAPRRHPPHLCAVEGHDPELWFPASEPGSVAYVTQVEDAKDVCRRCPMRQPCAQTAIDNGWPGIWGGTDEEDRRRARQAMTQAS